MDFYIYEINLLPIPAVYQKQCLGQRSGREVTVPSSLVRTSSIFLYGQERFDFKSSLLDFKSSLLHVPTY